jgi:(S)-2-hydroxyglutarate dehydrogenase
VYDLVIVGAGILGLAIAKEITNNNKNIKLLVIEKESSVARHQSSHNSGVIHSGLYYKPGSLKATNCISGYKKIIKFCQEEEIEHEICGKLVVATTSNELPLLDNLYNNGIKNNLEGLKFLNRDEIQNYEPYCRGIKAVVVPQTGIVNYKTVSEKYLEKVLMHGGEIALNTKVNKIINYKNNVELITNSSTYKAKVVVTCGGLHSDELALHTHTNLPIRIIPFRGEYYKLRPEAQKMVNHLIYPVPNPSFPFLGVHFTRMIDGTVECGPNAVFSFSKEGYNKFDFNFEDTMACLKWPGFRKISKKYWKEGVSEYYRSISKSAFVKALQTLVPDIKSSDLIPGGSGVRAQACDLDGNLLDDFDIRIRENVIHICNAPSPAATASLAIAETISRQIVKLLK